MSISRAKQFKMLFTSAERKQLQSLSDKHGLSASDYIRQLLRRESGLSCTLDMDLRIQRFREELNSENKGDQ